MAGWSAAVSLFSWLMTYFPLQMKRLVLTGVVLFLIAGGYYSRGFFFDAVMHQNFYQYTLQSDNLDDLHRFAPMVEAQMRGLYLLRLPLGVSMTMRNSSFIFSKGAISERIV